MTAQVADDKPAQSMRSAIKARAAQLRATRTKGFFNTTSAFATAALIVGAIVVVLIAAQLLPQLIQAGANASTAIATTNTGNDTANSLRGVMALVISLTVLLGAVGFIVYAVTLRHE